MTTGLRKQYRRRSYANERAVWSGSTLFATNQAVLDPSTGSEIDLFKF